MNAIQKKLKALYYKAHRTIKSKTGSTLLMVVMVMSICIILGTSFMMLSYSSFANSVNNKTHTKATATAMSVADTVKSGLSSILESNAATLLGDNELELDITGNFEGDVTAKITVVESVSGVPSVVSVTIYVVIDGYTESVTFTASTSRNSVNDIINSVSNAAAATGGGAFSFMGKQLNGDVSLDGDYLVAPCFQLSHDLELSQGEITGNLYVNGSAILGIDSDAIYIGGNVYINGDLTINACHIGKLNSAGTALVSGGNVYVAGNIIMNGLTSTVATIWGNVYCGGNMYVQNTEISAFNYTTQVTDGCIEAVNLTNAGAAFNYTYGKYSAEADADTALNNFVLSNNSIYNGLATKSVSSIVNSTSSSGSSTIIVNFTDGTSKTIYENIMDMWNVDYDGTRYFYDGQTCGIYDSYSDYDYSRSIVTIDSKKYLVVKSAWWDGGDEETIWNVINAETGSGDYSGNTNSIPKNVIAAYENYIFDGNRVTAAQEMTFKLPDASHYSLTIKGNIYVQGDALLQTSTTLGSSGTNMWVGGDLTVNSIIKYVNTSMATNTVANGGCVFQGDIIYYGGILRNTSVTTATVSGLGTASYYVDFVGECQERKADNSAELDITGTVYWFYVTGDENIYQGSEIDDDDLTLNIKRTYTTNWLGIKYYTYYPLTLTATPTKLYFNSGNTNYNTVSVTSSFTKASAKGSTLAVQTALESLAIPTQVTPMFNDSVDSLNSNYIDRLDKKEDPVYVADVFKEMGVWKFNVNTTAYKDGFHGSYVGSTTTVFNKKNDRNGVNFTGVTISSVSFASTLGQAENLYNAINFYGNDGKKYFISVPSGSSSYSVLDSKEALVGTINRNIGSTDTLWMSPSQGGKLLNINDMFVWASIAYTGESFHKFYYDLPSSYWAGGTKVNYTPEGCSGGVTNNYISQFYAYYTRSSSLYYGEGMGFFNQDTPDSSWYLRDSSSSQTNHAAYMQNFYVPYAGMTLKNYLNYWGKTSTTTNKSVTMSKLMEWSSYVLRDLWKMEYDKIQAGTLTYDNAFWLKYVGVQACYNVSNPVDWNYFLMRDIYIDGTESGITSSAESGSKLRFGLSESSYYKESLWVDTTYGDTRIYLRPTGYVSSIRGNDSANDTGLVSNAVLFDYSTLETINWDNTAGRAEHIGYVYIIPNFYKGATASACLSNTTRMTGSQLKSECANMVSADSQGSGTSTVYLGNDNNTYYRYEAAVTYNSSYVISSDNTTKLIFETEEDENSGVINNAGSFIFIICEGPLHFRLGYRQDFQGVLYAPHERSVFEVRDGGAIGSANGGAIVTGQIWTNTNGDNTSSAYNATFNSIISTDPDFAEKLSQGLNIATIDEGSNTTVVWEFSDYS